MLLWAAGNTCSALYSISHRFIRKWSPCEYNMLSGRDVEEEQIFIIIRMIGQVSFTLFSWNTESQRVWHTAAAWNGEYQKLLNENHCPVSDLRSSHCYQHSESCWCLETGTLNSFLRILETKPQDNTIE
jgi:hypothetical protein